MAQSDKENIIIIPSRTESRPDAPAVRCRQRPARCPLAPRGDNNDNGGDSDAASHHKRNQGSSSCSTRGVAFQVDFVIPTSTLYSRPGTSWLLRVIADALWKHIVYARGLLPLPFHQLIQFMPHHNEPTPPSPLQLHGGRDRMENKRLVQMLSNVECFRVELGQLLSDEVLTSLKTVFVLLSLGPAFDRPREVYIMDCTAVAAHLQSHREGDTTSSCGTTGDHDHQHDHDAAGRTDQDEYRVASLLLRKWVLAEYQAETRHEQERSCRAHDRGAGTSGWRTTRPSSSHQCFLSVAVTAESYEQLYAKEWIQVQDSGTQQQHLNQPDDGSQSILSKVILRRGFSLTSMLQHKDMVRSAHVVLRPKSLPEVGISPMSVTVPIPNSGIMHFDTMNLVWLTLRTTVKGIRLPQLTTKS